MCTSTVIVGATDRDADNNHASTHLIEFGNNLLDFRKNPHTMVIFNIKILGRGEICEIGDKFRFQTAVRNILTRNPVN